MPKNNITYSAIEGRWNGGFGALVGVLGVLSLGGVWASYAMFSKGHYITGMSNQVPWGFPIVMAVYLIGLSAGSLVLSALSSVFGKDEFKPFARLAALLAALLLVGALLSIILDWGRPDRVMVPFLHFNPRSIFSLNGILYSAYILICFVYLWAMFTNREKWVPYLGLLAVFWAVLVHSGTGAIFAFVGARDLYHSALLPPSFIAAALSSGTALMILVLLATFKYTRRPLDDALIKQLGTYLVMFILVVTYFIAVETLIRSYLPKNYESMSFLLFHGGKITVAFWLGMVGLGNVFPLLLLISRAGKTIGGIIAACIMVVIGVLFERYIIVMPGQILPLEIFPGMEMQSDFQDGVLGAYSLSLPEFLQSLGIVAFVFLLYALGIKFFEMLPDTHLKAEWPVTAPSESEAIAVTDNPSE